MALDQTKLSMEERLHRDRERVLKLCKLLEEHNGQETAALDLSSLGTWTDFFVFTTVTSSTHMRGLLKFIKDFIAEENIDTYRRSSGLESDEWLLVDCGDFIVHIMNREARAFYELEKLWSNAERIFG